MSIPRIGVDVKKPQRGPFRTWIHTVSEHITHAIEQERDRWLHWFVLGFATGIGLYFFLPIEPPLMSTAAVVLAAAVVYALRPKNTLLVVTAGLSLACIAGIATAKLRTEWVRAPVLTKPIGPVYGEGIIEKREPRQDGRVRLTLRVVSIGKISKTRLPRRIRITTDISEPRLRLADHVSFRAKLFPPAIPALPGDYDFARRAWFQQIGAVGYALSDTKRVRDGLEPPFNIIVSAYWGQLRNAMSERITKALPGETGAIAAALITGERGGISQQTNDAYRDSGLFHILSISGMHMAIMGGTVFFALRFLLALFPPIVLRFPIKKWAAFGAAIAALGYLMISGMAFATVRSFIMIIIMFAAIILDRPAITLRNVAIAAFIILVLFPEGLLDPGFQMSFAAVAALTAAFESINKEQLATRIWDDKGPLTKISIALAALCVSTLVASAAVAPFAIYHFHKTQHYALLANLIAVPICNIIVMPAALATFIAMPFGLERIPLAVMAFGIDQMTACANWVASLPGAVSLVPTIPLSAFLMIVAGGTLILLIRNRLRLLGLIAIAAGVLITQTQEKPDLLVGADARLIALRGSDDKLGAISINARRADFLLSQWLKSDGDNQTVDDALRHHSKTCKSSCLIALKGQTVGILNDQAHSADHCTQADILLLPGHGAKTCNGPKLIIDKWVVRELGTHIVYIKPNGSLTVDTVTNDRGNRPWVIKRKRFKKNNR